MAKFPNPFGRSLCVPHFVFYPVRVVLTVLYYFGLEKLQQYWMNRLKKSKQSFENMVELSRRSDDHSVAKDTTTILHCETSTNSIIQSELAMNNTISNNDNSSNTKCPFSNKSKTNTNSSDARKYLLELNNTDQYTEYKTQIFIALQQSSSMMNDMDHSVISPTPQINDEIVHLILQFANTEYGYTLQLQSELQCELQRVQKIYAKVHRFIFFYHYIIDVCLYFSSLLCCLIKFSLWVGMKEQRKRRLWYLYQGYVATISLYPKHSPLLGLIIDRYLHYGGKNVILVRDENENERSSPELSRHHGIDENPLNFTESTLLSIGERRIRDHCIRVKKIMHFTLVLIPWILTHGLPGSVVFFIVTFGSLILYYLNNCTLSIDWTQWKLAFKHRRVRLRCAQYLILEWLMCINTVSFILFTRTHSWITSLTSSLSGRYCAAENTNHHQSNHNERIFVFQPESLLDVIVLLSWLF